VDREAHSLPGESIVGCKQDSENALARQVRETIQQVLEQSRGKQETEMPNTSTPTLNTSMPTSYGSPSAATVEMGNPGRVANSNLQQPFYQTNLYGPMPQTHPDGVFPRPPTIHLAMDGVYLGKSENVREQVARMLREFRLEPKGRARMYQKPYPVFFDTVPYPRGFRVPEFVRFTGEDSRTTDEHIGQFLVQVSHFGITDMHKIRLFPLSLLGTTFNWFVSLPPNTLNTWEHLEQKIHEYFYNGETKH
jgi:hypothetical protein